jgi:hypothetical protein
LLGDEANLLASFRGLALGQKTSGQHRARQHLIISQLFRVKLIQSLAGQCLSI